jgi:hypothetical protein
MNNKRKRGFASMVNSDGRQAHLKGTAHQWTTESAREAGRRGGRARQRAQHMSSTVAQ